MPWFRSSRGAGLCHLAGKRKAGAGGERGRLLGAAGTEGEGATHLQPKEHSTSKNKCIHIPFAILDAIYLAV